MPTNMYGLDQYGSQAEDIERRRRYAEFLQTQSMEPIPTSTAGGMTGNIHWTQGLAKMLQAYQGGKGQKKASEERTALSGRMQEERSRRLAEALRLGKGTPGSPMPPEGLGGGPAQPSQPGDPIAGLAHLAESGDPTSMQFGTQMLGYQEKQREREALAAAVAGLGQGGTPGGTPGGAAGGAPGGIQAVDPQLLGLSMLPGGAGPANLVSSREIAAGRQQVDWAKLSQAQAEWNGLSAYQKADLQAKGVNTYLDYAKAKDEGLKIEMPPMPGQAPAQAPSAPPPTGVPNFTTPQAIKTPAGPEVRALAPSPEITPVPLASGQLAQAAPSPGRMSPKQQREVAAKAAETTAVGKAKLELERPATMRAIETVKLTMGELKKSAQEVKDHPGLARIFGVMGTMQNYPGGQAANAQAKLNTLKDQSFAAALQALRDASKTGAGVGQVSNIEGQRFENMFAALRQAQSVEQVKTELDKIIAHVDAVTGSLDREFAATYGRRKGEGTSGVPAGVDPKLWELMTEEEKKAFQ